MQLERRTKNQDRRRAGYTLIELMVAMVVLSLGLFSVIQLQIVSIRGNAFAEELNGASLIAQGVMEEMMTRGLEWVDDGSGSNADDLFDGLIPDVSDDITTAPDAGNQLLFSSLQSLTYYKGNQIAASTDVTAAKRINVRGVPGDTTGLDGEAALYRVHYILYPVPFPEDIPDAAIPAQAQGSLLRVIVFVSWLNRDHGPESEYNWANWDDSSTFNVTADDFWKRHMVVASFFMFQHVM